MLARVCHDVTKGLTEGGKGDIMMETGKVACGTIEFRRTLFMKKRKIVSLLALLLVTAMLLVSCGVFGAGTGVADLLDKNAIKKADSYGEIKAVDTLLDVSYCDFAGDLYYFTKEVEVGSAEYTNHIVYNAAKNSIVSSWSDTDYATYEVEPLCGENLLTYEEYPAFYAVVATFYGVDGDITGGSVAIYDAAGNAVAAESIAKESVGEYDLPCEFASDLLLFGDVVYRMTEAGLKKVMDVSPFSSVLSVFSEDSYRLGDYYYSFGEDNTVKVYDTNLVLLSSYKTPEYAENTNIIPLSGDKILVQYTYREDELASKYDYMTEEGDKYQVVTELVNVKNGKAKNVKCDYLFGDCIYLFPKMTEYMGTKAEKFSHICDAVEITNRRLGDGVTVLVDPKGGIVELERFNGETVWGIELVANSRWQIYTEGGWYLTDERGNTLGVTNAADCYPGHVQCDGKLYDYNLKQVYDYESAGMKMQASVGGAFIFQKLVDIGDGATGYDYYLYSNSESKKIVDANDADVSFYGTAAGCYILCERGANATKYVYYNLNSTPSLTLKNPDDRTRNTLQNIGSADEYLLYTAKDLEGRTVVYRVEVTKQ